MEAHRRDLRARAHRRPGWGRAAQLQPEPMERALETHRPVRALLPRRRDRRGPRRWPPAPIRDATNREEFLAQARERSGLDIEVLSREEEAFYGYLAAVNSTTLTDGVVLDLGGGSMQLTQVADRRRARRRVLALGAVRMTERFLPGERATKKQLQALRDARRAELGEADWLAGLGASGRLVALGGTVRNLAAAAEQRRRPAVVRRAGLLARARRCWTSSSPSSRRCRPSERRRVPGHQARARRPDPRRRAWSSRPCSRPAASTRSRSPRRACARASSSPRCSPPPTRRCSTTCAAPACSTSPRSTTPTSPHAQHVARLALAMFDALADGRAPPRRRRGARAAVGGGDAARHRHGGRLRRPPQALALPDPQRRPARLLAARDRADRPDRALPPEGHARPGRASRR